MRVFPVMEHLSKCCDQLRKQVAIGCDVVGVVQLHGPPQLGLVMSAGVHWCGEFAHETCCHVNTVVVSIVPCVF